MSFDKNTHIIKNRKRLIYCGNCGEGGHVYRDCIKPITSLGILAYKISTDNLTGIPSLKFLLIQRKDSLCYVEFLRGRYMLDNTKYIIHMFEEMTNTERQRLATEEFDEVWNKLWSGDKTYEKQHRTEYETSKRKFNIMRQGYIQNNVKINMVNLLEKARLFWSFPEWGIPKGRRNLRESDINCATREFYEETGIDNNDYKLLDYEPVSETFVGSNGVNYTHIYYIAKCTSDKEVNISTTNIAQYSEIGNIGWYSLNEALLMIRPYNIAKKNAIIDAYSVICKYYVLQNLEFINNNLFNTCKVEIKQIATC